MLKKIIYTTILCLCVTACGQSGVDEQNGGSNNNNPLLTKEVLGAYSQNNKIFLYDTDLYQYAFNAQHRTFRIQNSAQDRYLSCLLSENPVAGKTISVKVLTKGISSLLSQDLQMDVFKTDAGKVWLWSVEKKIGLVIQIE